MRDPLLKGLSPATKALLEPLLAWPQIQARWRGDMDTVSRIHGVASSGEAFAIRDLLSYALSKNHEVQSAARSAIRFLFDRLPPEDLPALDEVLRSGWACVEDWYGLKLSLKRLKADSEDNLLFLALTASHRSGFVRAEAVRALSNNSSQTVIPFLLVRLVDWVEPVRRAADLGIMNKLKAQYSGAFVNSLGLLNRLSTNSRFRPAYREWIDHLLKDPACASSILTGLDSTNRAIRRASYAIAAGNPMLSPNTIIDRALADDDVAVRRWAFTVGPAFMPGGGKDFIRRASEDAFPPIRRRAFDEMVTGRVSPEDLSKFLFDRSTGIRRTCQALYRDRFGLAPVETYRLNLTSGNSKEVEIAARGIGETGTREDSQRLLDLLTHPSARVRCAAVCALAMINADGIGEKLLEKISIDVRSVAREAAVVLLQKRAVAPDAIWAAARKNPHERAQLAVLKQLWRSDKWMQLRFYLDSSGASDPQLAECALERLFVWENQFNRTFVQPARDELESLLVLLQSVKPRLPANFATRLDFILKSFLK